MSTNSKIGKIRKGGRVLPWKLRSVARFRQDIQTLQRARTMAESSEEPNNLPLQHLFNNIMDDTFLTSQVQNRNEQIHSSDFVLKINGKIDEEQTELFKKSGIRRKAFDIINSAKNYGYSVAQLYHDGNNVLLIEDLPRTNIIPQTGSYYEDPYDVGNPIKYRELKEYGTWILEFNRLELHKGDLGMLNKAAPHVLMKRFVQSCWSELCEIYGIPPRVLKTNTQDPSMLSRGESMMRDMGAAAYFIIDEIEELEFAQGVATNGDVYNNFLQFCKEELSLLICGAVIGQDTKNGNRSKDEAAQEVLWLLVQSDMQYIEEQVNNTLIPALISHGILKEGVTFEWVESEDTEQLFKFTQPFLNSPKYRIKPDWILDKFGVEVEEIERQEKDDQTDNSHKLALNSGNSLIPPNFFD